MSLVPKPDNLASRLNPDNGARDYICIKCAHLNTGASSERLQVLNQIPLLTCRQAESAEVVVVRDDSFERGSTSVVEIRWMLPQGAERRSTVRLVRGA